jgi:large subunit ribosomal protein L21
MISVIKTGGKQYLVKSGDKIAVERLEGETNSTITFDQVLLSANDDGTGLKLGTPTVSGTVVSGSVEAQVRTRKIRVIKFKRKVRYRRVHGHRQHQTKVKIA